ncbi:hypothetical protein [Croceiramulus getboli]|nr:hypothetical protein P8624_11395 [Flavobacteriaceae bacterium YJPT1-3]
MKKKDQRENSKVHYSTNRHPADMHEDGVGFNEEILAQKKANGKTNPEKKGVDEKSKKKSK